MGNKNTAYQNLTKFFNINTFSTTDIGNNDKKVIIRGDSVDDVRRKGLELQQRTELERKFFKGIDQGFQKAMQYEAARLPAYLDYEGMEYYPIIASALDLYMEEVTNINDKGQMLNIYSNNQRIKDSLDELFYDVININVNLPFWTRSLIKYGDNFVNVLGEKERGIINVRQLVNYDMERYEKVEDGKPVIRYKNRTTSELYNTFEIAHFRLLGDSRYLPYGSCLMGDTYIKTNNGVKQIKNIKKGDVVIGFDLKTQKKIEANVLDTVHSGKKEVYKISTRHNYIDSSKEHKILIYDKINKEFKYEFAENLKIGDYLIINKSDENNIIKKINKKEKYTVDRLNREFHYYKNIDCIPDEMTNELAEFIGFMFGDGWISNKKDVYFALGEYDKQNLKYINLLEKFTGKKPRLLKSSIPTNYEYSQAVVGSKMFTNILKDLGFKGKFDEKRIPDWVFNSSREIRESFLNGFVDADGSIFIDKWGCARYSIELGNLDLIKDLKYLVQSLGYKSGKISSRSKKRKGVIRGREINSNGSHYFYFFKSENKQIKKFDIEERISDDFIIEPIISIEHIGKDDVYDIHVDNENHNFFANNIVVHNSILNKIRRAWRMLIMAEDAMLTYRIIRAGDRRIYKIDVGNMDVDDIEEYIYKVATKFKKKQNIDFKDGTIDHRFNILGNDEDIFLPVRNGNTQTGVDTLEGMKTTDIHDIEYLRDNLFTGLSIPKPFLGFQDAAGGGKNMAQHDIRFAKKVIRIQQSLLQELNKLAIIHLYLKGFTKEEVYDFKLAMNNPSTQEETLRIELMQAKTQLYTDLTRSEGGIAAMSHTNAKRYLYGMSDDEIILDLKQQKIERAVSQELENTPLTIKRTGIFDDIENRFAPNKPLFSPEEQEGKEGGDEPDMGSGDEFQSPDELPEPEGIEDSYKKKDFSELIQELTATSEPKKDPNKIKISGDFLNKNKQLNEKTRLIISEMTEVIGDKNSFNEKSSDIDDDLNIEDIEDLVED